MADELLQDPVAAVNSSKQLFRWCIDTGEEERATSALVLMAIAMSRAKLVRGALRILNLAVRRMPHWHVPLSELALLHEALADAARARGDGNQARDHYGKAASLHRRASIAIRNLPADTSEAEGEQERERWCIEQMQRT